MMFGRGWGLPLDALAWYDALEVPGPWMAVPDGSNPMIFGRGWGLPLAPNPDVLARAGARDAPPRPWMAVPDGSNPMIFGRGWGLPLAPNPDVLAWVAALEVATDLECVLGRFFSGSFPAFSWAAGASFAPIPSSSSLGLSHLVSPV